MSEHNLEKKLIAAYYKMMERVEQLIDNAEQKALPTLQKNIDKAKQQAIELKEITQEEADKIARYLRRDIHDAAEHIESSGKEFSSWFSFDLKLVEDRLLEVFVKVADKTRLELAQLAEQAKRAQEYHTAKSPVSVASLVSNVKPHYISKKPAGFHLVQNAIKRCLSELQNAN